MPDSKQSKVRNASLLTASFIGAFCKRGLATDKLALISDIIDIASLSRLSPKDRESLITELLRKAVDNVIFAKPTNRSVRTTTQRKSARKR